MFKLNAAVHVGRICDDHKFKKKISEPLLFCHGFQYVNILSQVSDETWGLDW
jgi:hypothetical protein